MISVLMSCYNSSNTIDRAIESILKQTYSNFEFIICNDGSSDDTLQHIQKFSKIDKRIVIINNPRNLGLQKSLNRCIAKSKGNIIARMDADDISTSNRFYKQVQFLRTHPKISFVGANLYLSNNYHIYGLEKYPSFPNMSQLFSRNCFPHAAIMIRSNVLKHNGGYSESPSCFRIEDYELWLRLYAKGYRGANIQSNLYMYNVGSNTFKKRLYGYLHVVRLRYRFRKLHNFGNYFYILLPLLKACIPPFVKSLFHKSKYSSNNRGDNK